jgi:hypothetical protein
MAGGRVATPGGRLLADRSERAIDAVAGEVQPAFAHGLRFVLDHKVLTAAPAGGGPQRWEFRGDGELVTPPLVVGRHVFVGSRSGRVYALGAGTGRVAWSDPVGAPIMPPGADGALGFVGLSAGEGIVAVPSEGRLVAYESAGAATPTATPTPTAAPPRPPAASLPSPTAAPPGARPPRTLAAAVAARLRERGLARPARFRYAAAQPGRLRIRVRAGGSLLARGTLTFARPAARTLVLRPTTAGRRTRARRVRVTVEFVPRRGRPLRSARVTRLRAAARPAPPRRRR